MGGNSSLVSPLAPTPSEPWTPSSTTSSGSSDPEGSSSAASSSGSISPVAVAAAAANQTAAAMAASAHARLATEFGKGGKFKLAKDPRAHSAPAAAQHRKAEAGEAGNEEERWLYVMPRQRVRPRECDEVPDEFRRAGIGLCFEGKHRVDRVAKESVEGEMDRVA